jgi:hypothetical protein
MTSCPCTTSICSYACRVHWIPSTSTKTTTESTRLPSGCTKTSLKSSKRKGSRDLSSRDSSSKCVKQRGEALAVRTGEMKMAPRGVRCCSALSGSVLTPVRTKGSGSANERVSRPFPLILLTFNMPSIRCLRLGWINHISTRIIKLHRMVQPELVLYERSRTPGW